MIARYLLNMRLLVDWFMKLRLLSLSLESSGTSAEELYETNDVGAPPAP
jgi:hypothetical protein